MAKSRRRVVHLGEGVVLRVTALPLPENVVLVEAGNGSSDRSHDKSPQASPSLQKRSGRGPGKDRAKQQARGRN